MHLNAKIVLLCFSISLMWSDGFVFAEAPGTYNFLQDVVVENVSGEVNVRLEFQKPLEKYSEPVFYKRSAQIDFPLVTIHSESRYIPVNDSLVTQIYVSQFEPDVLRVRFILSSEDLDLKDKFQWESQGRFLKIKIFKNYDSPLDRFMARAKRKQNKNPEVSVVEVPPATAPQEPVKEETSVQPLSEKAGANTLVPVKKSETGKLLAGRKSIFNKDTVPVLKGKSIEGKPAFADSFSLRSTSLKMFFMLLVVLGIMLLIFYCFKKFVWKNSIFGGGDKPVKVLSTGYLGPKKSIALVEIAGEVLVLGIANENITLLSNIQDETKIDLIKNNHKVKNGISAPIELNGRRLNLKDNSDDQTEESFATHMKEFFEPAGRKNHSATDVGAMIRKNLERMKTAS